MDMTDYDVLLSAADLLNAAAAFVRSTTRKEMPADEKQRLLKLAAEHTRTAQQRMHLIYSQLSSQSQISDTE